MNDYIFANDEVQLFEDFVSHQWGGGTTHLLLTNKAIVLERNYIEGRGSNKAARSAVDVFLLKDIKRVNGVPQVKKTLDEVSVQMEQGDIVIECSNMSNAKKFVKALMQANECSAGGDS